MVADGADAGVDSGQWNSRLAADSRQYMPKQHR